MSTGRWMSAWVLWTAPVSLASALVQAEVQKDMLAGNSASRFAPYLIGIVTAFAIGLIESLLIARHRTPVRRWALATGFGSLVGMIVGSLSTMFLWRAASPQKMIVISFVSTAMYTATSALCVAGAQSLCLWGAGPVPGRMFWLAGCTLVRVVPAFLLVGFAAAAGPQGPDPAIYALLWALVYGACAAAGTAWLLDRVHFRPPNQENA